MTLPGQMHSDALQIDHVRAERDVLAEVHNPYVVKLYYSFQVGFNPSAASAKQARTCFHTTAMQ